MNEDVKQEWVSHLRSGDYEQGRAYLRREDDTYCCLGVLCAIAVKNGVIDEPALSNGTYSYEGSSAVLPFQVMKWAGLWDNLPYVNADGEDTHFDLASMNDNGKPFAEIADVIDAHF